MTSDERHVHFGWGYGPGILDFLWDVDLLGKRVAYYLSSENEMGWSAINDIQYERDMRRANELEITGQLGDPDDVKWLL